MLNKNNFLIGVLTAFLFPVLAFIIAHLLKNNYYMVSKVVLPFLVAIGINLVLIRICLKKEKELTAKGIMLATFVIMLMLFIFKIHLK